LRSAKLHKQGDSGMSEHDRSTKKNTPADAYTGTSAVQHAGPDEALFSKSPKTARAGANALDQIGSTNVSSIFWSSHTLRAHGTIAWNFGFPDPVQVFANSQVSVTMTELDNNGTPFLGAATMQVFNVVPQADGTITVKFNVDWSDFLIVQFNFIIAN
jgi:hypothetical protein